MLAFPYARKYIVKACVAAMLACSYTRQNIVEPVLRWFNSPIPDDKGTETVYLCSYALVTCFERGHDCTGCDWVSDKLSVAIERFRDTLGRRNLRRRRDTVANKERGGSEAFLSHVGLVGSVSVPVDVR